MAKEIPKAVRAYMSELGKTKSEAKAAASRQNAAAGAAARRKDLGTLPCTCGGCPGDPKTTCPRGRLLRQRARIAAALDMPTREMPTLAAVELLDQLRENGASVTLNGGEVRLVQAPDRPLSDALINAACTHQRELRALLVVLAAK